MICFQDIFFSSVGGINKPKHFGQSGQPMPEPVILTNPPANTIKYVNINDNLANLEKSLDFFMDDYLFAQQAF